MKILQVPELRKWNNQAKLKSQVWKLKQERKKNAQRPASVRFMCVAVTTQTNQLRERQNNRTLVLAVIWFKPDRTKELLMERNASSMGDFDLTPPKIHLVPPWAPLTVVPKCDG